MTDQTVPIPRPMRVSLVSAPQNTLGTLLYVWLQSRHDKPLPSPATLQVLATFDQQGYSLSSPAAEGMVLLGYDPLMQGKEVATYLRDMLTNLLSEGVPVTEFLTFVFAIENMSISLREQLVRHRIGVALDPRLGADIAMGEWNEFVGWSQTSRVMDLSSFYDEGRFVVPDSLGGKSLRTDGLDLNPGPIPDLGSLISAENAYRDCLKVIQKTYKALQKAGVHIEDCRQLIPLAATHRMAWQVNLKSLSHIVSKRQCWIAQTSMWSPLVIGVANSLRAVEPLLAQGLVDPPCFKAGKWVACPYDQVNHERVTGTDGITAPCPLWLSHNPEKALSAVASVGAPLWGNDKTNPEPVDGEPLVYWTGQRVELPGRSEHRAFPGGWVSRDPLAAKAMSDGRVSFAHLWHRDVDTGEPIA